MLEFDHAVVNVMDDLDGAQAQYQRLGFRLTQRGHHSLGSSNHLAVFGNTYLELLGYAPGEREKRAELWLHPKGLTGLAFRPEDAAALHADMTRAGQGVEACKDFSRPIQIDGVAHEARFRTFQLERSAVANGRLFFCQHMTPELVWRPEYQTHKNGVTDIAAAFVACTDVAKTTELLRATPGISIEREGVLRAGNTRLHLASPETLQAFFGEITLPEMLGAPMRMAGLSLLCPSLDPVARLLDAQGIPYASDTDWVQISPLHAGGLILRFVTRD